jgi:Icc-related predicted phosphoesterase
MTTKDVARVAVVGDLHFTKTSLGTLQSLFEKMAEAADVVALCGDLTDNGLPEEAHALTREIGRLRVPIVAVLGNHDYESGKQEEVKQILTDAGLAVLDGEAREIHGIGFAGIKGFVGGFGRRVLSPWGESLIKALVQESVQEAVKLESALSRLRTPQRIALLHYAPIPATVQGEPPEIFPFLGCSRLEDPLNRHPVNVVFHGHAHHGSLEGRTQADIPVYNVSLSLLARTFPERPPFHLEEIAMTPLPRVVTPEPQQA